MFLNEQAKFVTEILSQEATLPLCPPSPPPLPSAPVLRKHGIRKRKCSASNSYEDKADKLLDFEHYYLSMAQFWLETENDKLTNHIT